MKLPGRSRDTSASDVQPSLEKDLRADLVRRVAALEAELPSIKRRLQQFDYDLQDAVDGFYRRRQSDRMRDVREAESTKPKKPEQLTWNQIQKRALDKLIQQPADNEEGTQNE